MSDHNRKYRAYSAEDREGDFKSLQEEIGKVFNLALESPGPQAQATQSQLVTARTQLSKTFAALAWSRESGVAAEAQAARMQGIEAFLGLVGKQLRGLDVDIDSLVVELSRICQEVDDIGRELHDLTERTLQTRAKALEQQLSALQSQKVAIENRIDSSKKAMDQTTGNGGMGCLSVVVFAVLLQPLVLIAISPWREELSHTAMGPGSTMLVPVVVGGWLFLGYKVGIWVSRTMKNQPMQEALDAATNDLGGWEQTAPNAIQKLKADLADLTSQMDQFNRIINRNRSRS